MAEFVKYKVPEDLRKLQSEVIKKISKTGKIKIGVNEVTKSIERNTAKLVIVAEDVSPPEIVMHVPVLSKEKNIPFTYAKNREELGKMAGISAKASCISILDEGVAKKEFTSLLNKISEVVGNKNKKEEPKKEEPKKAEPKKEEPKKEEPKKEEPKKEELKKEEPKKEEPKKEEPKKEEPKKEEPKKEEPKKEEPKKAEPKKEEGPKKEEPKKEEPKKEDLKKEE
jgi:ribosomal protein L7Ae-like RNA K-turn-binding protein